MPTPSSIRRLSPLPLLLIGLAALAVLVLISWDVHAQDEDATPTNQAATGQPKVFPSAEGAGILVAATLGIADANGIPFSGHPDSHIFYDRYTYQWIRVDGNSETNVGTDSARYQRVDADIGNLIKVQVSFTDKDGFEETVTSLPFGPIAEPARQSRRTTTLVSNTGQSAASTKEITQQYAMGFRLGTHGQGYEISSVSIELAAVPSSLTLSLWNGSVPGDSAYSEVVASKLFDFTNPPSFQVGSNKFTAPAGAFAHQNVNYFIVLSGFGSSLSIKETTSDDEDAGGETGAILFNKARVRGLSSTGRWSSPTEIENVLRLALEGSRRDRGILASSYAQPRIDDMGTEDTSDDTGPFQEIISIGDTGGVRIRSRNSGSLPHPRYVYGLGRHNK